MPRTNTLFQLKKVDFPVESVSFCVSNKTQENYLVLSLHYGDSSFDIDVHRASVSLEDPVDVDVDKHKSELVISCPDYMIVSLDWVYDSEYEKLTFDIIFESPSSARKLVKKTSVYIDDFIPSFVA